LPLLAKEGYSNPIFATPATIDFVRLILLDSIKVQTFDLKRTNRKRMRKGLQAVEPVYSEEDVENVLKRLSPVHYNESTEIAPGCSIRVREAGHILGSVSIELTVEENGQKKVVIFSGDLGPYGMVILNDPFPFTGADLVFMESTYGDRDHRSMENTLLEGKQIIEHAIDHKGKILVPSFAVGRTQQLLYYLARGAESEHFPEFPVYLDSPMAIEATRIYAKHQELFDEETMALVKAGALKGDLSGIHISQTSEDSIALNNVEGPCMIIAGAGMCNAGRILHHLRHNLWNPDTFVVIVGFQGEGTLGRKLVDGAKKVRIFGEEIAVNAHIATLGGLSAHAGQSDLLQWFYAMAGSKPRLVLSHGEDRARKPLATIIEQRYGIRAILPKFGDIIKL
jgi:metallo-beta-lactamase family protein